MNEISKAILLLVANGYAVYRVPSEQLPKVLAPSDEEVEELAMGKQGYTVNEFCMLYGISRTFYYELQKQERGPEIMNVGKRTIISKAAADAWRIRMEADRA